MKLSGSHQLEEKLRSREKEEDDVKHLPASGGGLGINSSVGEAQLKVVAEVAVRSNAGGSSARLSR